MTTAETEQFRPFGKLPEDVNANLVAQTYLEKLESLSPADLHEKASWRDILAFTNTFRTFNGAAKVSAAWQELVQQRKAVNFELIPESAHALQLGPIALLTARFKFNITAGVLSKSTGTVILLPHGDSGLWKIWILSTLLDQAEALGDPDTLAKVSASNAEINSLANGTDQNRGEELVDTLIVGAGQNGLCMLGRLKALGVKAVALEQNENIGDNWTNRYASAKLHLSKWYANMPYGDTFNNDEYPYFLTAADLSKGYRQFVHGYGLDVRTSTRVDSASWDSVSRTWTVTGMSGPAEQQFRAKHLVFAVGTDQVPNLPEYPHHDVYKGVSMHSVDYRSADIWKGLKGVVVGTANTAHDVAEDMVEAGLASVTMVQRSPTIVAPWDFIKRGHGMDYHESADLFESDQRTWALPTMWYDTIPPLMFNGYMAQHPEKFEALEKRGFMVKRPQNFFKEIRERAGGHYLDVGCCDKIIDGQIDIKSGDIDSYTPTGLRFVDGSTLDADVIIWATGFRSNVRETAMKVVGPEIGSQLEDTPRWDADGEVLGLYRQQNHPAIWYAAGECATARLYSRFLALIIKADVAGVSFEPYRKTPGSNGSAL